MLTLDGGLESIDQYISVTELAKNNGWCYCYSGENTSAKHIENYKFIKPNRIGHGIKVVEDLNVVDLVIEK